MNRLIKNIFSLSILQIFTYLVPLIILPFLVKTIGVDNYGKTIFAQSLCAYFLIFTEFGFNLSANKEISLVRDDINKVSLIYSNTILSKIVLLSISIVVFSFLCFIDIFKIEYKLLLFSFLVVIGNAFTPIWLFQGLERMKEIVVFNIINKMLLIILMLIFIHSGDDTSKVPFIYGTCSLLLMLSLNIFAFKKIGIKFQPTSIHNIKITLLDSSQYFLSRIANEGLMNSITFLIGLKFGDNILGFYSMAERLYRAFYMLLAPINQSLYPYMVKTRNIKLFRKFFIVITLLSIVVSFIVIFLSPYIYLVLFNVTNSVSIEIFKLLCIATIFGVSNSLIGFPLLGALGFVKEANYSLVFGAIISFLYVLIVYMLNLNYFYFVYSLIVYEAVSLSVRLFFVKYYGVFNNEY
ncbi:TPA: oligosaccharide flippase family protein [Photobacterium damselae]